MWCKLANFNPLARRERLNRMRLRRSVQPNPLQAARDLLPLLRAKKAREARRASISTIFSIDVDVATASIAANLSTLSAQCGLATLLIDMNLAEPSHHKLFDTNNNMGISDVLSGICSIHETIHTTGSGVALIPTGSEPPYSEAMFDAAALTIRLRALADQFDIILIDAGCMKPPRAQSLIPGVDHALIVVRRHETSLHELRSLLDATASALECEPIVVLAE